MHHAYKNGHLTQARLIASLYVDPPDMQEDLDHFCSRIHENGVKFK